MGTYLKIGLVVLLVQLLDECGEALIRKTTGTAIYVPDPFGRKYRLSPLFLTKLVFQPPSPRLAQTLLPLPTEGRGGLRRARCPIDFVLIVLGSFSNENYHSGKQRNQFAFHTKHRIRFK